MSDAILSPMNIAAMVDIETMDTKPSAAIVSIGACIFDLNDPSDEIIDTFEAQISLESNEAAGRTFSAGTIGWWLRQSPEAQASLFKDPVKPLRAALVEFRMWVDEQKPKPGFIFAKDADFDVVILKHAFDQINQIWPFQYWQNRSVRTIEHVAYPDGDMPNLRVGTHHSAADDAVTQALSMKHCWQKLVHGSTYAERCEGSEEHPLFHRKAVS